MATRREPMEDDLDFDPGFEDTEVDVDELLAAIHEDHLYEPPRRNRRGDRSARRRIESRRERRLLKRQLSDWDSEEDDDVGDYDDDEDRY